MSYSTLALSKFILSLSILAHSAFVLTICSGRLNRKNIRLIYLLLSLILYPASMYLYIASRNTMYFQEVTGVAGTAVTMSAVYFLYNFPTKRKTTALFRLFYTVGFSIMILAVEPGFWPNSQLKGEVIASDVSWAAYVLALYVFTAIGIIINDTFRNQPKTDAELKRHLFKYFMAFAFFATITDVIVPLTITNTNVLLTSSASASSIIFSIGLYIVYKKSEGKLLNKNSFTQLLTIFLTLLIVYNLAIDYNTMFIIRLTIIAVAIKVGYDTLKQIGKEHSEHQQLKHDHQANMVFISDIAHRLKTPLAIIQFKTEPDQHINKQTQAEINEVAKTTVTTLRNIVQTGKIDAEMVAPNIETVDLGPWLNQQKPDLAALTPAHTIAIRTPDHLQATLDPMLVREAIYNLVDNARKFSPMGSTISISAALNQDTVVLNVTNKGQGISKQDASRIFDRHFQAKGARQKFAGSAGLGLSLVKWVAEAHGGHIRVSSSPENGTTFSLILPTVKTTTRKKIHQKQIKQLTSEI